MQSTKKGNAYIYGVKAEAITREYLIALGYIMIASRYKTPHGEIDLIMEDIKNKVLLFVEVKARRNVSQSHILESIITLKQITRCKNAAEHFLGQEDSAQYLRHSCRFDLIVMLNGQIWQHIENAWI